MKSGALKLPAALEGSAADQSFYGSLWVLVAVIGLAGCAGSVIFGHTIGEERPIGPEQSAAKEQPNPPSRQAPDSVARTVKVVTISVDPQAKEKLAADSRFKQDGLRAAVEGELRARHVFNDGDARASRTVEIAIDDFDARPTSNAVVFGYTFAAGVLAANIKVRDADGKDMEDFRIEANAHLASRASEDANPLGQLYRRFATLTVDHLTGVRSKPANSLGEGVPR